MKYQRFVLSALVVLVACKGEVRRAPGERRVTIEFRQVATEQLPGFTGPVPGPPSGPDQAGTPLFVSPELVLGNADIKHVRVMRGQLGEYQLGMSFTPEGAARLSRFTSAHIGQRLAVLVDGKIVMAPIVQSRIEDQAVVQGAFTEEEVKRLARGLEPD